VTTVVHPSEDRLIDLAARLLAPDVEAETLRHLENCPACESSFRSICRDAEIARLRGPVARRSPRWRWAAAAAAVILIAVSTTLWIRTTGRSDTTAYWFPVGIETVGLRTGEPAGDEQIYRDAVEAYSRRDPARVVALLGNRPIPEALDPLKIMLASALVKTGEPAKAEALLTELRIETVPQPDRDRASWILFCALTAEDKRAEARTVAETLASRPGEFSEAARKAAALLGRADQ
jgi:hypothetical protein